MEIETSTQSALAIAEIIIEDIDHDKARRLAEEVRALHP